MYRPDVMPNNPVLYSTEADIMRDKISGMGNKFKLEIEKFREELGGREPSTLYETRRAMELDKEYKDILAMSNKLSKGELTDINDKQQISTQTYAWVIGFALLLV